MSIELEAAKVRVAVQGHDSGAQVGVVDSSPVSRMYFTTIEDVSAFVSALEGTSLLETCSTWRRGRM